MNPSLSARRRILRTVVLAVALMTSDIFVLDATGQTQPGATATRLPAVGAYYYYWYRHPDVHFANPTGSDGLFQHFIQPEGVNYESVAWHENELRTMVRAGLDFVLPVYWGIPDKPPGRRAVEWSDRGLTALTQAAESMTARGEKCPRIAMFYDTSTLLRRVRGEGSSGLVDLTTEAGMKLMAATIVRFFEQVPAALRFRMEKYDGLVVLYNSFGAPHEKDLLDRVVREVGRRARLRLFVIAETSWKARANATYTWGSALRGPTGDRFVMTLGPGYNDTPVPGRGTPIRDREQGRFYAWSWDRVLLRRPSLVLIETWNEFHEGTGIAPCREYGEHYVQMTRRYIARLKAGIVPDPKKMARLIHPDPLPRPDTGWWRPKKTDEVRFVAARSAGLADDGLRIVKSDDGPFQRGYYRDRTVVTTPAAGSGTTYLYFGIADEFAHGTAKSYQVEVEVFGGGQGKITLQYDSWDGAATLKGSYKSTPQHSREGPERVRKLVFTLPDARFSNRQNGGSDFRLAMSGATLRVMSVTVRRLPQLDPGAARVVAR